MLDWKIGDRIIAVDPMFDGSTIIYDDREFVLPMRGCVYHIRTISVYDGPTAIIPGKPCIRLQELVNPVIKVLFVGDHEPDWFWDRFRKVRTTDISDLQKLAKGKDHEKKRREPVFAGGYNFMCDND